MQTPQQHLTAIADLCQKFHRELDELLEHNPLPVETNRVLEDAAKAIDGPLDFFVMYANQRIGYVLDEKSTLDYKMSIHGFQRKPSAKEKELQEKVDGALHVIATANSDYDPPMRPYWLVSIEQELKDDV